MVDVREDVVPVRRRVRVLELCPAALPQLLARCDLQGSDARQVIPGDDEDVIRHRPGECLA
jgi:hypothetical protein